MVHWMSGSGEVHVLESAHRHACPLLEPTPASALVGGGVAHLPYMVIRVTTWHHPLLWLARDASHTSPLSSCTVFGAMTMK